jgi:hypothetical protein
MLPVILLVAIAVFSLMFGVLWYCMSRQQPTLLVLLIVGVLIAGLFPLPPTREQRLFTKYRQDYEAVVGLVQQQQLPVDGGCVHPSPAYAHVTDDSSNCVFIDQRQGLRLEFISRNYYRPIVFADSQHSLKIRASPCGGDGVMVKQLAEQWYLCNRDFN